MAERVYVYAIAAANIRPPENLSGFGGPLSIIPYGELAAVVSQMRAADAVESEGLTPAATAENLLRHERIVEAVCAGAPALPARFGTALADSDAVTRALAKHYSALRSDLLRIGDKVEMGVSVLWHSAGQPADPPEGGADPAERRGEEAAGVNRPGAAYLRARQVEYRRAEATRERAQALAREVDIALRPLAIESRRILCPSDRLALRDEYLLERGRVSEFERAFDELRRHHEARFLLSGPWPPYSFVTPLAPRDAQGERETQSQERRRADESGRASGAPDTPSM